MKLLRELETVKEAVSERMRLRAQKIYDDQADADMDFTDIVNLLMDNDIDEETARHVAIDNGRRVDEAVTAPFRKNDNVVLSAKGLLGTVVSVNKAWEFFTVKFVDGRQAQINFNQANQLKKFSGKPVTAGQNAEISSLMQNGSDPEEVADIMRVSIDTVLQLAPEKGIGEESKRTKANSLKEAKPLMPKFFVSDKECNSDGVMVLVMSDQDADDYHGINVLFGKNEKVKGLVTGDSLADKESRVYKTAIVKVAKDALTKDDKDFLKSLSDSESDISEDWKTIAANTAASAAILGSAAVGISHGAKDATPITVDGKEYLQHALPSEMSKVQKKKDSNGNDVYVWVEKSGMKPQYTYYWYAPIKNDVKEGFKKETAAQAFARYESLKKSRAPQELLDKVLSIANSLMDDQFKKTQAGMESKFAGSDWWEEVKKMYKIKEEGNKWVVVSNAKDWKQTKDWEYDTKYEALEQLERLIKYKAADRKKGVGDVDKDFERVDALRKREEK